MPLTRLWFLETAGAGGDVTLGPALITGTVTDATAVVGAVTDPTVAGALTADETLTGALTPTTNLAGEVVDTDIEGTVT